MGQPIGQQIVDFARAKRRHKVGSGECFDLADAALRNASQKTASDFGKVSPDADYVWGKEVPLTAIQAGDVIQYRDYVLTKSTEVETSLAFPDGATLNFSESSSVEIKRPHHTAIATGSPNGGAVRVIEQNVDRGHGLEKLVDDGEIHIAGTPKTTTKKSTTIRIDIAWGNKVKRMYGPRDRAAIDAIVKKYLGKSVNADVTTTESLSVSGTLKAYRPQAN